MVNSESDNAEERKVAGMILSSDSETSIMKILIRTDKKFSELQKELRMTSGRLNYHLLKMKSVGLLSRSGPKRYTLTQTGKRVAKKYLL